MRENDSINAWLRRLGWKCSIALMFAALTSCYVDRTGKDLRSFQEATKLAEVSLAKNNFDEAERHYKTAIDISEGMNWADGKVMSKRKLGDVSDARGDYLRALDRYSEARSFCLQSGDCSEGQLASTTDSLLYINLFRLKDPSPALDLIKETLRNRDRFKSRDEFKSMIGQCCSNIAAAGFTNEADQCGEMLEK